MCGFKRKFIEKTYNELNTFPKNNSNLPRYRNKQLLLIQILGIILLCLHLRPGVIANFKLVLQVVISNYFYWYQCLFNFQKQVTRRNEEYIFKMVDSTYFPLIHDTGF